MMFCRKNSRAIRPSRGKKGDSGIDLFAVDDVLVAPGEIVLVSTGVHLYLEEGETAVFWDKSGRASNGITILGGLIDGPYRGELIVVATNVNLAGVLSCLNEADDLYREQMYSRIIKRDTVHIPYGKALTQIVLFRNAIALEDIDELSIGEFDSLMPTERGSSGFGSSD